jgi:Ca2+/Na+ antiporter
MAKTYKLTPAFFSTLQTKHYSIAVPVVLLSFLLMFLISVIGSELRIRTIIVGLLFLLFAAWVLFKSLAEQRKIWASYSLVIDNDSIRRVLDSDTIVDISKNEISRIREYPDGNIYIESRISKKGILIPSAIDGYPEIRSVLSGWHPFESSKGSRPANITIILFVVLSVSLVMRIFYTGNNEIVSISIGIVLLLVFTGTTVYAYNKSTDRRSRRALWWILLPVAGVVFRLYTLLFSK